MLSLCLSAFQRLVEKMLFAPDEKIGRGEERGEGGRGGGGGGGGSMGAFFF